MNDEAVKIVVWPRKAELEDGSPVVNYVIVGAVVSKRDLGLPNESFIMTTTSGALLDFVKASIEKGDVYEPNHKMGDAADVLLSLGGLTPESCKRKKKHGRVSD